MTKISWHETHRGVILEGPHWRLDFDVLLGLYNLTSLDFPSFLLHWARARVLYRKGRALVVAGTDDGTDRSWTVTPVEDDYGPGLRLDVWSRNKRRPSIFFNATLYQNSTLLMLEVGIHNTLDQSIDVESLEPLEIDPDWGGKVSLGSPLAGVYRTGWQSWSPAGWKRAGSRDLRTRLGPLTAPMHDTSRLARLRAGTFRADIVGVLTPAWEGPSLLAGLLSTADQFGALHARMEGTRPALSFECDTDGLPLAPDEQLSSERLALKLAPPEENPLESYAEALGKEMGVRVQEDAPRGWCSWTAFYLTLSEQDVLQQAHWLAEHRDTLPVDVILVDDGWEKAVGDWEPNDRFPHGMRWLAEQIQQAGFVPGLWLAPFMVHPRSRLSSAHSEWLLQDEKGKVASAGFNWNRFCYGLDVTRPEVQKWTHELITKATEYWGYRYLKLDFLYAAALEARRHRPAFTRAQALRRGLEVIRQAAGPTTFLLGCGCPLGPAIGLVDGMRISADVAPNWKPREGRLGPLVAKDPAFPSTYNAVLNTVTQEWMHRRLWLNDPDALILRQGGNRMKLAEVRSLAAVISFSGGSWMLGDDMTRLEPDRQQLAQVTLPLHRSRAAVPDLLAHERPGTLVLDQQAPWGHGWAVAMFNWEDHPVELDMDISTLGLADGTLCHMHEFWTGEYRQVHSAIHWPEVEAHGCRVFLIRPPAGGVQWLGSSLHLLQGPEVQSWAEEPDRLTLTLHAGRAMDGYILLAPPPGVTGPARVDGATSSEQTGEGLWRIYLQAATGAPHQITIRW